MTALAKKPDANLRLLEKVEVVLASCQKKLDEYEMEMGNYFIAVSPYGYNERARSAALQLKEQMRGLTIRTLSD